jgi:cold shock CspA family protein
MFIERDDGASPNVFLHRTIAERAGLAPLYDGRRVRCATTQDPWGNCAAIEVAELYTPTDGSRSVGADADQPVLLDALGSGRGGVQISLSLSPGEIRQLIELGYLDAARSADRAAVAAAARAVMRRVVTVRQRPAIRPDSGPGNAA